MIHSSGNIRGSDILPGTETRREIRQNHARRLAQIRRELRVSRDAYHRNGAGGRVWRASRLVRYRHVFVVHARHGRHRNHVVAQLENSFVAWRTIRIPWRSFPARRIVYLDRQAWNVNINRVIIALLLLFLIILVSILLLLYSNYYYYNCNRYNIRLTFC